MTICLTLLFFVAPAAPAAAAATARSPGRQAHPPRALPGPLPRKVSSQFILFSV